MKRHWWGVTEAISDPEAGDYVPLSEFIQQEWLQGSNPRWTQTN